MKVTSEMLSSVKKPKHYIFIDVISLLDQELAERSNKFNALIEEMFRKIHTLHRNKQVIIVTNNFWIRENTKSACSYRVEFKMRISILKEAIESFNQQHEKNTHFNQTIQLMEADTSSQLQIIQPWFDDKVFFSIKDLPPYGKNSTCDKFVLFLCKFIVSFSPFLKGNDTKNNLVRSNIPCDIYTSTLIAEQLRQILPEIDPNGNFFIPTDGASIDKISRGRNNLSQQRNTSSSPEPLTNSNKGQKRKVENITTTTSNKKKKNDINFLLPTEPPVSHTLPTVTSTTAQQTHISITDPDVKDFISNHRGFNFNYTKDTSSHTKNLFISEVPCLKSLSNNKKTLGVFSSEEIETDTIIGQYCGTVKRTSKSDMDESYLFEINGSTGIDADQSGNWTSLVNGTADDAQANVIAEKQGNIIVYKTCKPIKPGEQLVIYYGKNYSHDDKTFRYCRSSDSYEESAQILAKNMTVYPRKPTELSADVARTLGTQPNDLFYIPTINPTTTNINWDRLPLLTCHESGIVLQQYLQNNFTPLMYACALGDLNSITHLLEQGSDPNAQASIDGYAPLHIVMKSSVTVEVKKQIIAQLLAYGASLSLQDKRDISILHEAIAASNDDDLVEFLMTTATNRLEANEQKESYVEQVLNLVNQEDLDPFLYSLSLRKTNISIFLAQYLTASDMITYLKSEEKLFTRHIEYIKTVNYEEKIRFLETLCCNVKTKNALQSKNAKYKRKTIERTINHLYELFNVFLLTGDSHDPSISDDDQKSTDAPVHSIELFKHRKNLFQHIIQASDNKPSSQTVKKLNDYFSSPSFANLSENDKKKQLTTAINKLLDHLSWYVHPYSLSLKLCKEMRTGEGKIYAIYREDGSNRFDCLFESLEQEEIRCTITFDPPKESPSLEDVLAAISAQSKHDISDEKRLEYAHICFDAATNYFNALENMDGATDNLRTKIHDADMRINKSCNSAELPNNP